MNAKPLSEEQVFQSALEIDSTEERLQYIEKICENDSALRDRVLGLMRGFSLLSSLDQGNALGSLWSDGPPDCQTSPGQEVPGGQIGRYKLLEQIGEGGFGVVFMAEQQEPVVRKVALKIIKRGMDTRQVIARFEAERQALAMMDHPNIAHVLDGGETEHGRPYFVMDLVRGIPITRYCEENKLTVEEKLSLFMPVCQAVQHAHQKGIIHRDLKPSNVMITLHDGMPVPKVIDFGVAKAINQRLTERTLFTRYAQMIGTPAYMSPEQAEMSGLDVDTRSDIYSLGVLLYEVLTGTTPHDAQALASAAYGEMQRIICEEEPPKPSTRITELHYARSGRAVRPSKSGVARDLDWIVMKALEKDRRRRYETANALALDLERHLADEAVSAGPPTFAYRAGKLMRRHRVGVGIAALLVLSLVTGLGLAMAGFHKARNEATRASKAEELARTRLGEVERERNDKEDALLEAERQRNEALWNQYVARQYPIADAWRRGDFGDLAQLLEEQMPQPGQPDFRGWEWTFFQDQCAQVFTTIEGRCPAWRPGANEFALVTLQEDAPAAAIELRLPESGALLRQLTLISLADEGEIQELRWSGNGEHLAYRTDQSFVGVIDVRSEWSEFRRKLNGSDDSGGADITTIDLGPEGNVLAVGDRQGRAALWNVQAAETMKLFHDPVLLASNLHRSAVSSIRISPTGDHIATALLNGQRRTWDVQTGRDFAYTPMGMDHAAIEWDPSGRRFASADANLGIAIYKLGQTDPVITLSHPKLHAIDWNASGHLISSGFDQVIKFWNGVESDPMDEYNIHASPVKGIAIDSTGEFFASEAEGKVRIVDRKRHPRHAVVLAPDGAATDDTGREHYLTWNRTGEYIASGQLHQMSLNSFDTTWRIWNTSDESLLQEALFGIVRSMTWKPDQSGIWMLTHHGALAELDLRGRAEAEWRLQLPALPYAFTDFSPNSRWLVLASERNNEIELLDTQTGLPVVTREIPGIMRNLRWSHDSRLAGLSTQSGDMMVWDPWENILVNRRRMKVKIENFAWDPSDRLLALARTDGTIQIVRADTLDDVILLRGHAGQIRDVDWSANGRIASAGLDGAVRIWDAATGHQLLAFYHPEEMRFDAVRWNPDGRRLAAGDPQGRIYLWGSPAIGELPSSSVTLGQGPIAQALLQGSEFPINWSDSEPSLGAWKVIIQSPSTWTFLSPSAVLQSKNVNPNLKKEFASPAFDDRSWESGMDSAGPEGGFGYGDPVGVEWEIPEDHVVTEAYLRHRFSTSEHYADLALGLQFDDWAVVYLDGEVVGRAGTAEEAILPGYETAGRRLTLTCTLAPGEHVLAIALYNSNASSSDLRIAEIALYGRETNAAAFPAIAVEKEAERERSSALSRCREVIKDFESNKAEALRTCDWGKLQGPFRHLADEALATDDITALTQSCTVLASSPDRSGYDALCRSIVAKYQSSAAVEVLSQITKVLLLRPHSSDPDLERAVDDIVRRTYELDDTSPRSAVALAMADYRRGAHESARRRLRGIESKNNTNRVGLVSLLDAMSSYHLGDKLEALTLLEEGRDRLERHAACLPRAYTRSGSSWGWEHFAAAQLVLREAENLIYSAEVLERFRAQAEEQQAHVETLRKTGPILDLALALTELARIERRLPGNDWQARLREAEEIFDCLLTNDTTAPQLLIPIGESLLQPWAFTQDRYKQVERMIFGEDFQLAPGLEEDAGINGLIGKMLNSQPMSWDDEYYRLAERFVALADQHSAEVDELLTRYRGDAMIYQVYEENWEEAKAHARKLSLSSPLYPWNSTRNGDIDNMMVHGLVLLMSGDRRAYTEHCRLASHFLDSQEPSSVPEGLFWRMLCPGLTVLLDPKARESSLFEAVTRDARQASARRLITRDLVKLNIGLAELRIGNAETAIEVCHSINKNDSLSLPALAVGALAEHQRGNSERATSLIEQLQGEMMDPKYRRRVSFEVRLCIKILLDEALSVSKGNRLIDADAGQESGGN